MSQLLKRFILLLGLCLLSITVTTAQSDENSDSHALAASLPPVDVYASIRTDVESLARLDDLLLRISTELPDTFATPLTVSDLITDALGLGDTNLDVTNLLTNLLGEQAAVGIDLMDALSDGTITADDALMIHAVATVRNRGLLEVTLTISGLVQDAEVSSEAGYTIYRLAESQTIIALKDSEIRLSIGVDAPVLQPSPTLADEADFAQTMDALPAADYLAHFYASTGRFVRDLRPDPAVQEILLALGFEVDTLGPLSAGFQIDAEERLSADIVQARSTTPPAQPTLPDPDFVRYVPDDVDIFAHTTDINQLIGTVSGLIASLSGSTTRADIYTQIENLVRLLLDLNLQTDILPWASGNYGIAGTLPELSEDNTVTSNLYMGALFEITDSEAAATLVTALAETIEQLLTDTTVTQSEIGNADGDNQVEVYIVEVEDATFGTVEIAIGVFERILFVATYDMAVSLLGNDAPLSESDIYQGTHTSMLPNAQLEVFIADRLPGDVTRLVFTLLEPLQVVIAPETVDAITAIAPAFFGSVVQSSGISALTDTDGNQVFRLDVHLESARR